MVVGPRTRGVWPPQSKRQGGPEARPPEGAERAPRPQGDAPSAWQPPSLFVSPPLASRIAGCWREAGLAEDQWRGRRGAGDVLRLLKGKSRGFNSAFRGQPAEAPARVYKQSALAPAPPVSPWAALAAVPGQASGPEPGRALWGPGLRDGERGGGRGWWRGSLLPTQAFLCSQPHAAPLLQGPGFLPLYNKLRNLQRLLGRRTREARFVTSCPCKGWLHYHSALVSHLQSPDGHRVEQGHVFRPLYGQLATGVVVHDFRDAAEGWAVLAQHVLVFLGPGQLHVHEALAAPGKRKRSW